MAIHVIDCFCGFGGSSLGFYKARNQFGQPVAHLRACINHDKAAVRVHELNFPDCLHFVEDVRFMNLEPLMALVAKIRAEESDALILFHASIDCTQHSNAKGGRKKLADSRTLAWELYRYVEALDPDYITIENVEEFRKWGPDDKDGFPIKDQEGLYFYNWCETMNAYGYRNDWRMLNAADFGGHQTRDRLFGQFAKSHLPISWPTPTHTKKAMKFGDLFSQLLSWKPVSEVIDLTDIGHSIFSRQTIGKKPLKPKTIRRIYYGAKKYTQEPFLSAYYSNGTNARPLDSPAQTLTTKDRLSLITPVYIQWIDKDYSGPHNHQALSSPGHTLTTNPKLNLLTATTCSDFCSPHWTAQEGDSPELMQLRAFMKQNYIYDLYYRGLKLPELMRIQGFPPTYQTEGKITSQKKWIGNSVYPLVQQRLIEATARGLLNSASQVTPTPKHLVA